MAGFKNRVRTGGSGGHVCHRIVLPPRKIHRPAPQASSALRGQTLTDWQAKVERRRGHPAGKVLAFLADRGTILDRSYDDGVVSVRVRLARADLARVDRMLHAVSEKDCTTQEDD